MKNKNKCVITSKINKFFIIPFLVPFFCALNHFFQSKQLDEDCEYDQDDKSGEYGKYQFPTLFYNFISKILSFIPLIVSNLRSKSEVKESEKQKKVYHELIEKKAKNKKLYLYMILISFLEVIFKIEDFYFKYLKAKKRITGDLIEKRMGFVLLIPFLSFIILKKKIYSHRVFSLCLTVIGFIILNVVGFKIEKNYKIDDCIYHIIHLLFSGTFALSLVLIKYIMINYLIFPYKFLFIDGILSIMHSFIFIFILKLLFITDNESYVDYISRNFTHLFDKSRTYYAYLSLSITFSFCYYTLNILSLFYFSPYINVLTDLMSPLVSELLNFISSDEKNDGNSNKTIVLVLKSIAYMVIAFGALILNEIIIFNCCGLSKGTFNDIIMRSKKDTDLSNDMADMSVGIDETLSDTDEEDINENEGSSTQNPQIMKI